MEDRLFPPRNSVALDDALGLLKKQIPGREQPCWLRKWTPNYLLVSHNRVWKSLRDSPGDSPPKVQPNATDTQTKGLSEHSRAAQQRHLLYELPATAPLPWGFIRSHRKRLDSRHAGLKPSKLWICQLSGVPGSSQAALRGAVSLEDTGNTVYSQGKSPVVSRDRDSVIFSPNVSTVFGTFF